MKVMAILNATPDSFSDGGDLLADVHGRVARVLDEGADLLDVGGESTRPGHTPVPVDEEINRVAQVIHAIRDVDARIPISIDTSKAPVAGAALELGAGMVNDVRGLRDPALAALVASAGCPVVVMRDEDVHGEIVAGVRTQLGHIVQRAMAAGVQKEQIIVDPGLGFGTRPGASVEENLALVDAGPAWGPYPVLIGASRKRFIGTLMDEPDPKKRVSGSVAVALRARAAGASYIRVHDVAATVAALH